MFGEAPSDTHPVLCFHKRSGVALSPKLDHIMSTVQDDPVLGVLTCHLQQRFKVNQMKNFHLGGAQDSQASF